MFEQARRTGWIFAGVMATKCCVQARAVRETVQAIALATVLVIVAVRAIGPEIGQVTAQAIAAIDRVVATARVPVIVPRVAATAPKPATRAAEIVPRQRTAVAVLPPTVVVAAIAAAR
jgi:hypothetical protein